MSDDTEREVFTMGLRELADFYDANPHMPMPVGSILCFFPEQSRVAEIAAMMGKSKKTVNDIFLSLARKFGGVELQACWYRNEVCTARVVGTRTVIKDVVLTSEKREVEEDVIEWECEPLLSKGADA